MNNEKALNWLYNNHPGFSWGMVDFSLCRAPGAYCIFDSVSKMAYFGRSKNVSVRISMHKSQLQNNEHENPLLQSAFLSGDSLMFFCVRYTQNVDAAEFLEAHWASVFGVERCFNSQAIYSYFFKSASDEKKELVKNYGYTNCAEIPIGVSAYFSRQLPLRKMNVACIERARELVV